MKKKALSLFLALILCLGLLPVSVSAAGTNPPDWYFLFAIFKNVDANGEDEDHVQQHLKYSMTQDQIDLCKKNAKEFEAYMTGTGVMRAHVDVIEVDTTITELTEYVDGGSWLSAENTAPLLKDKVDLDQYDHVTCITALNVHTSYAGLTGSPFENGTGHSCINIINQEYTQKTWIPAYKNFPVSVHVHEFLHFMERLSRTWGTDFGLHNIRDTYDTKKVDYYKGCYTDIILNRAKGNPADGTGANPTIWANSPRELRTRSEWTVSAGVPGIGDYAFQYNTAIQTLHTPSSVASIGDVAFRSCPNLTKVTFSSGLTSIGEHAFRECTSLSEVNFPSSLTSIESSAFYGCSSLTEIAFSSGLVSIGDHTFRDCTSLSEVTIPASVTSIGYAAFWKTGIKDVYYAGTAAQWKAIKIGEYNKALTGATIHYNSPASNSPATPAVTVENIPASGTAVASTQTVSVDGKSVEFQMYALVDANGNATNYIKLRDMAYVLNNTTARFSVGYDSASNQISLATGQAYAASGSEMTTPFSGNRNYTGGAQTVKINGQPVDMTAITLQDDNGGGYNYFKLRDLGAALGFNVGYSNEQGVYIESGKPYQG